MAYESITYLLSPSGYIKVREWLAEMNIDINDCRARLRTMDEVFPIQFVNDDLHVQFKLVFPELTDHSVKVTL